MNNDTVTMIEADDERLDLIHDFCRETEESLDTLDTHITVIRKFIYDLSFEITTYVNFIRGLQVEDYLGALQAVNRVVHTIKGVSAFLELEKMNTYCHKIEELTHSLTKGKIYLDQFAYEIIANLPVVLNRFVEALLSSYTDSSVSIEKEIETIENSTNELLRRLDGKIIHLDEIRGQDLGRVRDYKKELKVSIDLKTYDNRLREFQAFSQETLNILRAKGLDLDTLQRVRAGLVGHLDALILSARSNIVLSRYPRLVTDLGQSLGKNIVFKIEKNDAQARPDIWDSCHNALVHLVRNAVDHGIELPEERESTGKTPLGHINMSVTEDFRSIYVSLEDDGRGIDGDEVGEKAVEKGIIRREQLADLSQNEKQRLIFAPGFSTRSDAGQISGRGVGMDAVLKEIEGNLNGKVILNSQKGTGLNIILEIPKTETLSECILFGDENYNYAVPVVPDVQYLEINPRYVNRVMGENPVYTEGDLKLPLLNLFGYLHPGEYKDMSLDYLPVIKVGSGKTLMGIVVPAILGHERIKIDRRKVLKKVADTNGLVFGYGLTDPVTVVLDLEYLQNGMENRANRETGELL